jgi:membrane protease subunit (stomatin/prohibitin family)
MMRRRRPLLRGAMMAGAGAAVYQAGKRHEANAQREDYQDQQIDDLSQNQARAPTSAPAATDTVSELERLKALLDSGALTQDEFDAAKQKILSA